MKKIVLIIFSLIVLFSLIVIPAKKEIAYGVEGYALKVAIVLVIVFVLVNGLHP